MPRDHKAASTEGTAFIVLTLLAWSSVPLFLRYFTSYLDAWTTNGFRYGISALIWTPWLIWHGRRRSLPPGLWKAAIIPSAINCVGQCCFAWAPYFIHPGLLTFMLRLQIIFVTLGAYLLFPEERSTIRRPAFWLAITAGMLFGAYVLTARYFCGHMHPITAFAAIGHCTAAGLITIMLIASPTHGAAALELDAPRFALLLASGLIGIGLSHAAYYAAMARLGVAVCAGVILLQPFITGTASTILFGERLTTLQWLCGGLAMAGAATMLYAQSQTRRAEAARAEIPEQPATTASLRQVAT
jgi:drug/metabolite transporter (DMT)-like permease